MTKFTTLLALMFCLACGGAQTSTVVDPVDVTGTPTSTQSSAFDYMPADTYGYAEFGVARGLTSPYYVMIRDATDATFNVEQKAIRDRAIEFAQLVDHVYLSFGPNESGNDADLGIAVIEGRFTIQNVIDFATAMEPSDPPQRAQVGTFEAATLDNVTMVDVGNGRFVFGPSARATQLALNPPNSGFHGRPFFQQAENRIDAEAIVRVISERPQLAGLDREIESMLGQGQATAIQGGAFSADAMNGARLRGFVMTADASSAQILEGKMNEMRQEVLAEPMLAVLGVRGIIESIAISSDATSVSASLDISDSDLRRLFQMGLGMMQMGAASGTPPAPVPAP